MRNRHQIIAAIRTGIRLDPIIDTSADRTLDDNPAFAEDPHMIRYRRLAYTDRIYNFAAAFFAVAKKI